MLLRSATLAIALIASFALPAGAQSTLPPALSQQAGGLPVWAWIALALVVVLLLAAAVSSRRKRRQAVIKTRIG